MDTITLALDAMGGDHGPSVVVPAALQALNRYPQLRLILVGGETAIQHHLQSASPDIRQRIDIRHTTQVVEMDDLPSHALRTKKDSSMRVAINLVKDNTAQAAVSAGNTGALMATARFVLRTMPGISRPAICAEFPTLKNTTRVLDLGANVDSDAEHLFQFAVMGSVLANAVDNVSQPKVGLLNIGEEEIKGNEQVKQAAVLLEQSSSVNYIGYVEGDDIYMGEADVIVCDGFVGNVALKTSEGLAKLLARYVKEAYTNSWYGKFASLLSYPVLKSLRKRIDPSRYNGASLLGLNGIVVKSHGGANVLAFRHAIEEAMMEVEKQVPDKIRLQVEKLLLDGTQDS